MTDYTHISCESDIYVNKCLEPQWEENYNYDDFNENYFEYNDEEADLMKLDEGLNHTSIHDEIKLLGSEITYTDIVDEKTSHCGDSTTSEFTAAKNNIYGTVTNDEFEKIDKKSELLNETDTSSDKNMQESDSDKDCKNLLENVPVSSLIYEKDSDITQNYKKESDEDNGKSCDVLTQELNEVFEKSDSDSDIVILGEYTNESNKIVKKCQKELGNSQTSMKQLPRISTHSFENQTTSPEHYIQLNKQINVQYPQNFERYHDLSVLTQENNQAEDLQKMDPTPEPAKSFNENILGIHLKNQEHESNETERSTMIGKDSEYILESKTAENTRKCVSSILDLLELDKKSMKLLKKCLGLQQIKKMIKQNLNGIRKLKNKNILSKYAGSKCRKIKCSCKGSTERKRIFFKSHYSPLRSSSEQTIDEPMSSDLSEENSHVILNENNDREIKMKDGNVYVTLYTNIKPKHPTHFDNDHCCSLKRDYFSSELNYEICKRRKKEIFFQQKNERNNLSDKCQMDFSEKSKVPKQSILLNSNCGTFTVDHTKLAGIEKRKKRYLPKPFCSVEVLEIL